MDRIQTFIKYILWLVTFYIISNFLINVGLNSMYKDLKQINEELSDTVLIQQAEATAVNGRIRGTITNEGAIDLNEKYIKATLYSERGVEMGTKYIEIEDLDRDETKPFEIFFEASNTALYSILIVEEKDEEALEKSTINFMGKEINKVQLLFSAAVLLLPMI